MKKYILILAAIMLLTVGCGKQNPNENLKAENNSEKVNEEKVEAYPKAVKVSGTLYEDTGYINSMVTCSTADGEIKTAVSEKEMPTKDDESNFGTGYSYQVWEEGYVNVQIDNKWILFKDVELKDDDSIPKYVAHFTAKVIQADEDAIMVEATHVDEEFSFKELMTKPISLPLEAFDNSADIKEIENKTVEVYFGGEIKNMEPESSIPIHLEKIYRIDIK